MTDVDLAILGQPPTIFDEYERRVRLEYSHVPETAFRAGRAKVLQTFLKRETIYRTPAIRGRGAAKPVSIRRITHV